MYKLFHKIKKASKQLLKSANVPDSRNSSNEEQHNSDSTEQLLQRIPIAGTPFTIIGNHEHRYIITIGKYKLTNWETAFWKIEDAEEFIHQKPWELIFAVIGACIDFDKKQTIKEPEFPKPEFDLQNPANERQ